jgi:hypothetical protein
MKKLLKKILNFIGNWISEVQQEAEDYIYITPFGEARPIIFKEAPREDVDYQEEMEQVEVKVSPNLKYIVQFPISREQWRNLYELAKECNMKPNEYVKTQLLNFIDNWVLMKQGRKWPFEEKDKK